MYKEINIEKIKTLEKDILDCIMELKNIISTGEENFLKDKNIIYSLRYLLIEIVESMASICNHIITRIKGEIPEGYPDCFEKMAKNRIINEKLAANLKKIAKLRNILIHKYWQIDDSKLFNSVKENIDDFEEFLKQVNNFLKLDEI